MTDFMERQVQRLLGQAEQALDRLDWADVKARAEAVLRLDPQNADALALLAAVSRDASSGEFGVAPSAVGAQALEVPPSPGAVPNGAPRASGQGVGGRALPISFVGGRYQVK
ncbi:MAG: hypothetical protein EXR58_08840 [Chloroflexi bacterium]|nr:hypothetical protein [Chloroflexota bacterium]